MRLLNLGLAEIAIVALVAALAIGPKNCIQFCRALKEVIDSLNA